MVLEHLIDVGSAYAEIIIHLSQGESPWRDVDLAAVAPRGGNGPEILDFFRSFLNDFAEALAEDIGERDHRFTHPHPWYGRLNAQHWHSLAAFHQSVHRDQMERIVSALRRC
jgi:hypothetical protein